MEAVPKLLTHLQTEMSKVVVGQEELRNQCLLALLCKGHVLLEGVPGIAKTLAVKTLSRLLRLKFQRVQCTSDLMPADITGTNVLNMATSAFQFHPGPVFTDLLLVDEVNRMPPRTQAALLECMEEHQVTIDGTRHQLSPLFTVFATQNRDYLIPDDVKSAALPVLRHRLVLKPEADLEGITPDQVIQDVLRAVEVPK